jgi:predicted transcriptional regulator of viral defense system
MAAARIPPNSRPRSGLARARDLAARGVRGARLTKQMRSGILVRRARGLYMAAEADVTEHHSLAEVARLAPNGIVCLLTALRFHGLGTQIPSEIWIAIHVKAWRPRLTGLPVRIVYMSGPAFTKGFDVHDVEHVAVRITSAAKTVADCFKFRNKIGLDVALEALREYRRQRLSLDDLHEMARVCRVERVMRPYLEAIL